MIDWDHNHRAEGWLYLAVVMDLYTRMVVGVVNERSDHPGAGHQRSAHSSTEGYRGTSNLTLSGLSHQGEARHILGPAMECGPDMWANRRC